VQQIHTRTSSTQAQVQAIEEFHPVALLRLHVRWKLPQVCRNQQVAPNTVIVLPQIKNSMAVLPARSCRQRYRNNRRALVRITDSPKQTAPRQASDNDPQPARWWSSKAQRSVVHFSPLATYADQRYAVNQTGNKSRHLGRCPKQEDVGRPSMPSGQNDL